MSFSNRCFLPTVPQKNTRQKRDESRVRTVHTDRELFNTWIDNSSSKHINMKPIMAQPYQYRLDSIVYV